MDNNGLSYDDFLRLLNIQTVLQDAGYQLNRRDGLRYPSYIRLDSDGHRIRGDKFIVTPNINCCFQPPRQKVYNVISLIKEFPHMFTEYRPGMSPDLLVNLVCNRLLNNPVEVRNAHILEPKRDIKPFRMDNYDIHKFVHNDRNSQRPFFSFFKPRGLDFDTMYTFRNHYMLTSKHRPDGLRFQNLCFPLKKPGETAIVGFEERGRQGLDGKSYKGKAEGSNSSEGLWIANLSGKPLDKATSIIWFESAYDAMSYYQLHRNEDLKKGVFISTGGTPTERQMKGVLSITPGARHYLGFDKDVAGRQFVTHFKEVAKSMGFRWENVLSCHPLGQYKDWNDALQGKKDQTLIENGEIDYDYHAEPAESETEELPARPLFRR